MAKSKSQEKREKVMAEANASTPNPEGAETPKTETKEKTSGEVHAKPSLVETFYAELAEFERVAVADDKPKAVLLFRRWVENKSDADLASLL